jgi:hypothetical protein
MITSAPPPDKDRKKQKRRGSRESKLVSSTAGTERLSLSRPSVSAPSPSPPPSPSWTMIEQPQTRSPLSEDLEKLPGGGGGEGGGSKSRMRAKARMFVRGLSVVNVKR